MLGPPLVLAVTSGHVTALRSDGHLFQPVLRELDECHHANRSAGFACELLEGSSIDGFGLVHHLIAHDVQRGARPSDAALGEHAVSTAPRTLELGLREARLSLDAHACVGCSLLEATLQRRRVAGDPDHHRLPLTVPPFACQAFALLAHEAFDRGDQTLVGIASSSGLLEFRTGVSIVGRVCRRDCVCRRIDDERRSVITAGEPPNGDLIALRELSVLHLAHQADASAALHALSRANLDLLAALLERARHYHMGRIEPPIAAPTRCFRSRRGRRRRGRMGVARGLAA